MGDITRLTPGLLACDKMLYLRDHPFLNVLRRLRGWTCGDLRVMVEAKDGMQHFFRVYECRSRSVAEAEPLIAEALAADGATLVEIAQERPATVPMPRSARIIALSARIYFGEDSPPIAPASQDAGSR